MSPDGGRARCCGHGLFSGRAGTEASVEAGRTAIFSDRNTTSNEPGTAAPATRRLFFALWPDAPARAALVRLAHEIAHHGHGKAPREDNLHVTLAFLGPVADERLGALERIGRDAAAGIAPFGLSLERVGGTGFGIAWLSCDGVPPSLAALHAALAAGLAREGFPTERRMFRPHLTLARHCARAAHRGAVRPIGWQVERLSLVESTLAPGGSRYREVAGWVLGMDGAAPERETSSQGA